MEHNTQLNERELDDDFPVYLDYLYVADGRVIRSEIQGTVKALKYNLEKNHNIKANVITTCDILGRKEQQKQNK